MTYTNIAYDTVLKGLETILGADFKDAAAIYLDSEYQDYQTRKSIRLVNLPTEHLTRLAGQIGSTDSYPVEATCYVPKGNRSVRVAQDEVLEIASRVKRLIDDNCHYEPSGVYKWHDASAEIEPNPDRDEELDPSEDKVSMAKVFFIATVTELT